MRPIYVIYIQRLVLHDKQTGMLTMLPSWTNQQEDIISEGVSHG
jgi:hypothetical protein